MTPDPHREELTQQLINRLMSRGINDSTNNAQLIRALGVFLSGFHWQVYATPSFRTPVSRGLAEKLAHQWITALGSHAFAYVAYEKGEAGGREHCHALVGAVRATSTSTFKVDHAGLVLMKVREAWRHGDIKVDRYDPNRGACWYLSKFPTDGEIVGEMRRHRVRRKGK